MSILGDFYFNMFHEYHVETFPELRLRIFTHVEGTDVGTKWAYY